MITLRSQYTWAIAVPTSIGVRLSPEERQPVHMSSHYRLSGSSAETNAASISAALGLSVKVLTNFVKGSPIAQLLKSDLMGRGMSVDSAEVEQGGPWGYRHQFNIADTGFGARGPRVYNDRAGFRPRAPV